MVKDIEVPPIKQRALVLQGGGALGVMKLVFIMFFIIESR